MASRGERAGARPGADPDWLTLGQAAKYLGVAQSTIRKWSDQGLLPAFYTPGGHRRFRRRDLDGFLARSGRPGQPGPLVLIVDDDPGAAPRSAREPRGGGLLGPRGRKRRRRGCAALDEDSRPT